MKEVLLRLRAGELSVDEALAELRRALLVELDGQARLDLGRRVRRGVPEVVLAAGKTAEATARLVVALASEQGQGLVSRLTPEHALAVEAAAEKAGFQLLRYGSGAAALRRPDFQPALCGGRAAIITAGTSDVGVADETRLVLEATGVLTRQTFDVGVAGLHRLFQPLREVAEFGADVIVVAAGMDGVLPGVVAGLVDTPVIGVPVSTGYGAGGKGEAALLTMLQSCSTGLLVVNIDNGVGAGTAAALIAARAGAARQEGRPPEPPGSGPRSRRRRPAQSSS